ncbi:transcription initiation factor IIF, beta subunit-domain-containing protein [Spinellus fusiger]|nr:transcription initiation factor IIF, beta subunit-domain-containing protein [Spinellus fusiger]
MSDLRSPDVDALFEDDPGSLDEVVDEEDAEDLKLDSVDTKVWLVKVPKFLANKWKSVEQDNVNLGSVRIYSQPPPGRSSTQISLVLPENDGADTIPREYSISILPGEVTNKFVFTENEHGGKSVSGTVHHECAATPTQFGTYRNIMRKRVMDAGTPQRTVQVLGQDNQPVFVPGASSSMPNSNFSDFVTAKKPRTDKEKATRMPRNELMDLLFAAFDRYPYWSFKGIVEHTKQPAQYLKEILSEICILNKRGPYAGNYQLKPEYKQRSAAERPNRDRPDKKESSASSSSEEDDDDEDDDEEEAMEAIHL